MPFLYGLSDDFYNFDTHASLAGDVHSNAAVIKVGYPHTGAGGLTFQADAAVDASEAEGLQVIVNLWTTTDNFGGQPDPPAYYAARVAEAAARWPDVHIELINEWNFGMDSGGPRLFGDWTVEECAQVCAAAVEAAPGRVIGPSIAVDPIDDEEIYLARQEELYDRLEELLGGDLAAAGMIGMATHMYPRVPPADVGAVEAQIERHIAASAQWGVPVHVSEVAFGYGTYGDPSGMGNLQPVKTVEMWERYFHDDRVGGLFFYRLAPNTDPPEGPFGGEYWDRWPLSTNTPMQVALEAAWGDAPPITAIDSSGHHRTGFYENVTGVAGTVSPDDGAAEFNGTNSVVTSLYDPWGGPFTLEAWVRTDSTASRRTIFGSAAGGNHVLMLLGSDVYFFYNGLSGVSWAGRWGGNGVWRHVVLTRSGTTAELFVNGTSQGTKTLGAFGASTPLQVGLHVTSHPMDGRIDEVAVYETVLSASRIGVHFGFADSALIGRGAAFAGGNAPLGSSPALTHPPLGGDVDVVITGGEIGAPTGAVEGLFPEFFPSADSFPASKVPATDQPLGGEINEVVTAGVHDTVLTGGSHDTVLTGGTVDENVTGGDVNEVVTGGEIIEEAEGETVTAAGGLYLPFYPSETYPAEGAPSVPGLHLPFYPGEAYPSSGTGPAEGLHLPFYPASETYPAVGEGVSSEAAPTGLNLGGDVEEVVNGGTYDETITGGDVEEVRTGGEVEETPTGDSPDESDRSGTYDLVLTGGEVL